MLRGIGILELAQGGRIQVAFCPLTGNPIVDQRDLPTGTLNSFTAKNPPQGENDESVPNQRRAAISA